jgi:hypothetical protein
MRHPPKSTTKSTFPKTWFMFCPVLLTWSPEVRISSSILLTLTQAISLAHIKSTHRSIEAKSTSPIKPPSIPLLLLHLKIWSTTKLLTRISTAKTTPSTKSTYWARKMPNSKIVPTITPANHTNSSYQITKHPISPAKILKPIFLVDSRPLATNSEQTLYN